MAAGKRPVPFRTRLAKPARADGTAPGRVWESRLPPAYNFIFLCVVGSIIPVVGVVVPTTLFFVHPQQTNGDESAAGYQFWSTDNTQKVFAELCIV